MKDGNKILRKPEWLKIRLPQGDEFKKVNTLIKKHNLHTICTSGSCPNHAECWERGTATVMILGDICTRACKFCNVTTGKPLAPDWSEPLKVAQLVNDLKLKHCVITSVDRDDLPDGGSEFWAETIRQVKKLNPQTTIETLIPDFDGNIGHIHKIIDAAPDIISHNLETVRRLTPVIRTKAKYEVSLRSLKIISDSGLTSKSGIMLGLGETEKEILETMDDLLSIGCRIITIGQYLQPSRNNYPVQEYITPEKFEEYRTVALQKGFKFAESAPLVRSSYHAERQAPTRIKFEKLGH